MSKFSGTNPQRRLKIKSLYSDVPCDVMSFSLTVYNKGKRGKDTEVAELHVDLSALG